MERKVMVFKSYSDMCKNKPEYIGIFQGYSQDHVEFETGPGNFPVAIVEKPNGRVDSVHVHLIEFVEATEPAEEERDG